MKVEARREASIEAVLVVEQYSSVARAAFVALQLY